MYGLEHNCTKYEHNGLHVQWFGALQPSSHSGRAPKKLINSLFLRVDEQICPVGIRFAIACTKASTVVGGNAELGPSAQAVVRPEFCAGRE